MLHCIRSNLRLKRGLRVLVSSSGRAREEIERLARIWYLLIALLKCPYNSISR
jgi:hypothetical protein